jgi:hypothetical protein
MCDAIFTTSGLPVIHQLIMTDFPEADFWPPFSRFTWDAEADLAVQPKMARHHSALRAQIQALALRNQASGVKFTG